MAKRSTSRGLFIASDIVTQGGDDSNTEAELKTGLGINQSGGPYAWAIHQIDFLFGSASEVATWANADSYVVGQLTTKSESSLVGYDTDHLIEAVSLVKNADGTPASAAFVKTDLTKVYSAPILVASDSVFIRVASGATVLTWTLSYRIHYEVIKLGIEDFYKLIRVQS